jgi:hypothetical protein
MASYRHAELVSASETLKQVQGDVCPSHYYTV